MDGAARKLAVLQGLIFAAARRANVPPEIARQLALWALEGIVDEFGNSPVYIPGKRLALDARNEAIVENHRGGVPIERICAVNRLSRRQVLAILQRARS